jgi:signal transduction histidine kinase
LADAVKSSFIAFVFLKDEKTQFDSRNELFQADPDELIKHLRQQRKEIVVRDELGLENPLKEIFTHANIAISLRLKTQRQIVGYVLFGDKRSGEIYSSQDLRLMAIVAHELAVAIQNALRFEEIKQFNITLQEKIEAATRELRKANTRLKELDEAKDEFISMASHQLRTPLTTVKGYLSMVLDGDVGAVTKDERAMIQRAFDGADRMVYLIADLLNVSRLQSGKFVIDNKPTDLAKIVQTEVAQLKESADNHQLKLTFHKPEHFPTLNLDDTKIRQVIMNFMDNAIYYTPKGGSIDVVLQATDKDILYSVTDTGLGVPKAEQHKLFTKFYRAGNARKMRPDGTGLGLFMVKKVIVAQGGAIIFNSTEGKGSTFGFTFPRAAVEIKKTPVDKPSVALSKA